MKLHGRNLTSCESGRCARCKKTASVRDVNDPSFILCEGCLLEWDMRQSGFKRVEAKRARAIWRDWAHGRHTKGATQRLFEITQMLAAVDVAR